MDSLTPELLTWVQTTAPRYGLSPEELIRRCTAEHGGNGVAIVKSEIERAMAALGVPATAEPAVRIGDKPADNETVILKKLTEDIFVRIWGDRLKKLHVFTMDFVDRHGAYIRTPRGMKIIMLNSPSKDPTVYSFGRALELADPTNNPKSLRNFHRTGLLPDWETYVVAEGARICIRYPGIDDYYFDIPFHQPQTVETMLGHYSW